MIALLNFAFTFFRIGLFTFGGGYAMIPLIISELTAQGLVTRAEITDIIAVSQVTPGTFAINAATFSGIKTFGFWGGVFGTIGVMLPSIILASLVARFYIRFKNNHWVKNIMFTLRPVVLGLIASAVFVLIPTVLTRAGAIDFSNIKSFFTSFEPVNILIAVAALVCVIRFKISPIIVVLASGVVGILAYALF
ncbi:MAG: chromate transporter [Eubacteriales bacterium]